MWMAGDRDFLSILSVDRLKTVLEKRYNNPEKPCNQQKAFKTPSRQANPALNNRTNSQRELSMGNEEKRFRRSLLGPARLLAVEALGG